MERVETAYRLRDLLAAEGLECWPKTTGGKGLHVIVPITPDMRWDAAHDYTRELPSASPAWHLIGTSPRRQCLAPASCSSTIYAMGAARPQ